MRNIASISKQADKIKSIQVGNKQCRVYFKDGTTEIVGRKTGWKLLSICNDAEYHNDNREDPE